MPKTYSPAPDDVRPIVDEMLKKYHQPVIDAGVTIDLISVSHDDEDKPALTLHGYPCAAVMRVVGIKERTKGAADVEITIDESRWMDMDRSQQRALIDHELEHIDVKMDPKAPTKPKLDCRGRPKIGMKRHDVQTGWFANIADRHGSASFEVQQAKAIVFSYEQSFFPFLDDNKQVGPSEKVRNLAARIEAAGPSTKAAVLGIIDHLRAAEAST